MTLAQLWPQSQVAVISRESALAEYLPKHVGNWVSKDLPLAGTEAMDGKVEEILRFDDAILRQYRQGGREFTVYIAYWRPGQISSREVAFHIPDKCWVFNGWKREFVDIDYRCTVGGNPVSAAQYRIFSSSGGKQHLIYWHVYDGRVILYRPDDSPSDLTMLTDLLKRGLRQRGEQYFLRVASSTPLSELWLDSGFQEVISRVVQLGPDSAQEIEYMEVVGS